MKIFLIALMILLEVGSRFTPSAAETPKVALPPAAKRTISYSADIHPLFADRCADCHLNGKRKGGLQLDSREDILKGGEDGAVVVPGHSDQSLLIQLVASNDPDKVMPNKGTRLTSDQIGLLRAWIDQGLVWDAKETVARKKDFLPAPLEPRRPTLPPARAGLTHPIDLIIECPDPKIKIASSTPSGNRAGAVNTHIDLIRDRSYQDPLSRRHDSTPVRLVDDRTFARRASLDVIGLLPAPQDLEAFIADSNPDKRAKFVSRLLADNDHYAVHWLTFWNDALRNDYQGTGYIDGGRKQITDWLYQSLLQNKPYDQFVRELISPTPDSEGFVKGILWRGAVNASQRPEMQAAQNIPQVFLGTNMKCASCHDSFINNWKLTDSYGLAAVYAESPLDMFKCDQEPRGRAQVKFLYPQLGTIDGNAPKAERARQLAKLLTSPQDGRFARTIVNRLWARFLGRGIIEPVDDMDQRPWNEDLLDWLATDLVDNGYDLKKTMERILTSRAYQRVSVSGTEQIDKAFVFRGPTVKRMSAEQFSDAVSDLTETWPSVPVAPLGEKVIPKPKGKWIGTTKTPAKSNAPEHIFLRKEFDLSYKPAKALAIAMGGREILLTVNGKKILPRNDGPQPLTFDLIQPLVFGTNVITVELNHPSPPTAGKHVPVSTAKNEGFFFYARISGLTNAGADKDQEIRTGTSWRWSSKADKGWTQPGFRDESWDSAVDIGDFAKNFNGAQATLEQAFGTSWNHDHHVRAALMTANPLMVALGRPNREQVVTNRPITATTLQLLELTNGGTIAGVLSRGADNWLGNQKTSTALVTELYRRALGRPPTARELSGAIALVGNTPNKAGVEDLLWSFLMLPEFQLIY